MKKTLSRRMAFAGMLSALAVAIMCMGSLIPAATFCCPVLASLVLIAGQEQCGKKMSWVLFWASAILSLLLASDKEAAGIYLILGYYPLIKCDLDRLGKIRAAVLKVLLFNLLTVSFYLALMYLFRMSDVIEEMKQLGIWLSVGLLLGGNVVFFLYDAVLVRMQRLYRIRMKKWA